MLKFGFHMSIAGSVANAPKEAVAGGYSTLQMFTTSSRSWSGSRIEKKAADEFRSVVSEGSLEPFAHIPYLCNPGSPNEEVYRKSRKMLVENLENCKALGIKHLVIHMGSHLGKGFDGASRRLADTVKYALGRSSSTMILLENSAGYTNSLGSHMDEIGSVMRMIGSNRVGVCLDTCHAFAAGYDISSKIGTAKLMDEIEEHIGLAKVKLVHLNDAKYALGSGLDRHWHIGKGYIGYAGFKNFFRGSSLENECFIMETPVNSEGDESTNMDAVRRVMGESGITDYTPKAHTTSRAMA